MKLFLSIALLVVAAPLASALELESPVRRHLRELVEAESAARMARWPKDVKMPPGLVSYRRAQYSQEIAVTNGADRITPVHRSRLKTVWHQSGGMEGVRGFVSDVYHYLPEKPYVGIYNMLVWNGSNFQYNRGWSRSYADGTVFVDNLSYEGRAFETRQRTKVAGRWLSKVIHRDEAAYPPGYTGLKQSCSSCHDMAGTGGYAVGLVPGGDGVLSDPFAALER